jgi:protein-disulfide isomerase
MSHYARYLALAVFGVAVVVVGSARTVSFVLSLRATDQAQDARIDELEQQLRDLRAAPAAEPVKPAPPFAADDDRVHGIPVGSSPVRGPSDAWVTIVAFTDYQCPFCGRVQQTLRDLQERNPDVRVVVKHLPLPFHVQAHPAAVAAECAHEQGRFWQVHDALYAEQRDLAGFLAQETWEQYGLDAGAMRACIDGSHAKTIVDEDAAFAAAIHASATPTFYVNGRKVTGAQPLEQFQAAVDVARAAAKASGAAAADYYTKEIVAKNAP